MFVAILYSSLNFSSTHTVAKMEGRYLGKVQGGVTWPLIGRDQNPKVVLCKLVIKAASTTWINKRWFLYT